jgi:hypothetical protein
MPLQLNFSPSVFIEKEDESVTSFYPFPESTLFAGELFLGRNHLCICVKITLHLVGILLRFFV